MSDTPTSRCSAGAPQKMIQRGKGKAITALAAASGRDPAAIVAAASLAVPDNKAPSVPDEQVPDPVEEEATPLQMYESLSVPERYRFECFRRCGFPSKSIETFVAQILQSEAQRRYLVRRAILVGIGATFHGSNNHDDVDSRLTQVSTNMAMSKKRLRPTKRFLLKQESKRRRAAMDQPLPYFYNATYASFQSSDNRQTQTPLLENMVVPESASEIVAVVSTLAKCYAQRLVAAARRVADAEEEIMPLVKNDDSEMERRGRSCDGTDDRITFTSKLSKPLQPHHFLEAHRYGVKAGIDPGFWMLDKVDKSRHRLNPIPGVGFAEAAALGHKDRNASNYLATLAAQDAYDVQVNKRHCAEEQEPSDADHADQER